MIHLVQQPLSFACLHCIVIRIYFIFAPQTKRALLHFMDPKTPGCCLLNCVMNNYFEELLVFEIGIGGAELVAKSRFLMN